MGSRGSSSPFHLFWISREGFTEQGEQGYSWVTDVSTLCQEVGSPCRCPHGSPMSLSEVPSSAWCKPQPRKRRQKEGGFWFPSRIRTGFRQSQLSHLQHCIGNIQMKYNVYAKIWGLLWVYFESVTIEAWGLFFFFLIIFPKKTHVSNLIIFSSVQDTYYIGSCLLGKLRGFSS